MIKNIVIPCLVISFITLSIFSAYQKSEAEKYQNEAIRQRNQSAKYRLEGEKAEAKVDSLMAIWAVEHLKPFELTIIDSDYSMAYSIEYICTEKKLRIVFKGELEGERDSTLYTKNLSITPDLTMISNINVDSLKDWYTAPCINDGTQISVNLKRQGRRKHIHVSNYYQPDVGRCISFVNDLVPEKYKINYNKKELINHMNACK